MALLCCNQKPREESIDLEEVSRYLLGESPSFVTDFPAVPFVKPDVQYPSTYLEEIL